MTAYAVAGPAAGVLRGRSRVGALVIVMGLRQEGVEPLPSTAAATFGM
jgi:hypothetical protein